MTEPIDQATKDLIEKEAVQSSMSNIDIDFEDEKMYEKGYIAGATVWAGKLKQERELRKELVEYLEQYKFIFDEGGQTRKEIESLIQKAKDKSHE